MAALTERSVSCRTRPHRASDETIHRQEAQPSLSCAVMNRNHILITIKLALALCLFAPDARAAQDEALWNTGLELGAVQTSGNTRTTTLNASLKASRERAPWRTTLSGNAVSNSAGQRTTAEKYDAALQQDWRFSERGFLFGRLGFESDRFAGYRQRTSETVGYGRQLVKHDTIDWRADLGGGLRQTRPTVGARQHEVVARASSQIAWQFSAASKLTEDLHTEGGAKGWTTKSVTALQSALNAHLSSKISLTLTHNSSVPAGAKKLDTESAITLVVNF
ncbi:MAG: DUF481 domain-containing protein [Mariprofundaceae bacterium]